MTVERVNSLSEVIRRSCISDIVWPGCQQETIHETLLAITHVVTDHDWDEWAILVSYRFAY